jgi:hypothetical protein
LADTIRGGKLLAHSANKNLDVQDSTPIKR